MTSIYGDGLELPVFRAARGALPLVTIRSGSGAAAIVTCFEDFIWKISHIIVIYRRYKK